MSTYVTISFFTFSGLLEQLHPCSGCSGCSPGSIILTSKISYLLFCPTSLIKLKLERDCKSWETTNSNSPGAIKPPSESTVDVQLCCTCVTSLSIVYSRLIPFFAEPSHHVLTFLHPKFLVKCTGGVAFYPSTFCLFKP